MQSRPAGEAPPVALAAATQPWTSDAGGGPRLRGRRVERPGATVHFLPGNGFCGGVYWPFLRRLLPARGLFLHDIEGHGESEVPPHFSGIRAVAARIPQVMQDQGLRDGRALIGMGHSFGAALTLKVAAENPGLFKALVLLDPIVFPAPVWFSVRAMSALGLHPMKKAALRRRRAWPGRQAALDHLRGRGIYQGWTEEALECFVDHAMAEVDGQRVLRCPPELEAEIYERPLYPWPSFRKIDVPVLFLHGAASYPFLPPAARLARRANPRIEVASLPGQHCFMQEDPAAAQAAVAEFLDRHAL